MPHLLLHRGGGASQRTYNTHTCCQAFGSTVVNTCFKDLDLLRLEFKHPKFRMRGNGISNFATAAASTALNITTYVESNWVGVFFQNFCYIR